MIKLGRTHSRAGAAIDALEDFLGLFRHIWSTYHPNKSNGLLPARLFSLMPLTHLYCAYATQIPYRMNMFALKIPLILSLNLKPNYELYNKREK